MTVAELITPYLETQKALKLHCEEAYAQHASARRSWMGPMPGLSSPVHKAYAVVEKLEARGMAKYGMHGAFDY